MLSLVPPAARAQRSEGGEPANLWRAPRRVAHLIRSIALRLELTGRRAEWTSLQAVTSQPNAR